MASFHNKILRVNLTTKTIKVEEPGAAYLRRYMGGWNFIADVLLREVPQNCDPLGPENKLVFAPGVLCGLPISGASRSAVGAKSPLTGGFGAAECGGNFGAQFKRSGFDALIVEGKAETPVYIWTKDGECEIRDASHLWGKTTKETQTIIREELGERRAEMSLIGLGGENMVTWACVMSGLKDAAGRTGMGAVMGSKNLKAVASLGTMGLEAVDNDTIRAMARRAAQEVAEGTRASWLVAHGTGGGDLTGGMLQGNLPIRNFRDGDWPEVGGISNICDKIGIGMEGCWACAVRCKKVVEAENEKYKIDPDYGGAEYETLGSLGSTCGVDDLIALSEGNQLCNAYSLDTIGTGVTIAFAMECFENGLITLEDTQGIDLRFGNGDAMVQMIHKIADREGFGAVLAKGMKSAAAEIGGGAEKYCVTAKNQAYPMHEPRLKRGLAIGYAISPTGADHVHSLHDTGLGNATDEGFNINPLLRGMGAFEPIPLESIGPAKVRASMYHSIKVAMTNCVSMCHFPDWTVQELTDMIQAATGWDVTDYELYRVGERSLTLARLYNMREGLTAEDDKLAPRSAHGTTDGALVDGGIDPEELHESIQLAYGMMGWDPETGVPTSGKLYELGVDWAVDLIPA